MTRRKCKPQILPNNSDQLPKCIYPIFMDPQKLYRDNMNDIAKSLVVIMVICGIHECKANGAIEVIKNIFRHYNEARYRPECAEPPKKMCKYNVIMCLAKKCMMTLVETQLTYYIIKYALKAYFNKMPQIGVRSAIMDAQMICDQESAWKRAAKRTVQIYEGCRDILRPIVKNYYNEIICVYKSLYYRMKQRTEPLQVPGCKMNSKSSERLIIPSSLSQQSLTKIQNDVIKEIPEMENEYPYEKFLKCCKCKAPLDFCTCNINPITGKLCIDCSQGPYVCEWFHMDKEPQIKAKYHVCPIDCETDSSLLSEDVCTCDLPQVYDCQMDDDEESEDSEYGQDCFEKQHEIECREKSESESDTEDIEPIMDGCTYCCHMPICSRKIYMEKQKPPPHLKRDSDDPIFVEFQVIPPSRNFKNVRLPPDVPVRRKRSQFKRDKKVTTSNSLISNKNKTDKDEQNSKNLEDKSKTGKSQDGKNENNADGTKESAKDNNNAGKITTEDANQLDGNKGAGNKDSKEFKNVGSKSGSGKNKTEGALRKNNLSKNGTTKGNGSNGNRFKGDESKGNGSKIDGSKGKDSISSISRVNGSKIKDSKGNISGVDGSKSNGSNGTRGQGIGYKKSKGVQHVYDNRKKGEGKSNFLTSIGNNGRQGANKASRACGGKLSCCKRGNKRENKQNKSVQCKPVLIPKNRIVPAPVTC